MKHNAKHCVIKELHSLLNLFCIESFPMPRHNYGIEPQWASVGLIDKNMCFLLGGHRSNPEVVGYLHLCFSSRVPCRTNNKVSYTKLAFGYVVSVKIYCYYYCYSQ